MQRMRWIVIPLLAALPCCATTLSDELRANSIPQLPFSAGELASPVNGTAATKGADVYLVYMRLQGEMLTGSPGLVHYDRASGRIRKTNVETEEECCGAPDGITIAQTHLLLSFHNNPSSSTVLVLDRDLKVVGALYGFGVTEIAPDEIVYTEAMEHFAPVHPERLAYVNLRNMTATELYPPVGDAVRAEYARAHESILPAAELCARNNDPCIAKIYDEDLRLVGTDGRGQFAMTARLEATHFGDNGVTQAELRAQSTLYIYKRSGASWQYCQLALTEPVEYRSYGEVAGLCIPRLPVVPDRSTADYSPLPPNFRRVQ